MLDLSTLNVTTAAAAGTMVELEHPGTGDTLADANDAPYYVEVRGEDSAEVKRVDRKHADQRADRIRRGKSWDMDQDTLEAQAVERLAAATISWYLPPLDGETLDCTPKNLKRVYASEALAWVTEQVAKAMKDRKRFFSKRSMS